MTIFRHRNMGFSFSRHRTIYCFFSFYKIARTHFIYLILIEDTCTYFFDENGKIRIFFILVNLILSLIFLFFVRPLSIRFIWKYEVMHECLPRPFLLYFYSVVTKRYVNTNICNCGLIYCRLDIRIIWKQLSWFYSFEWIEINDE